MDLSDVRANQRNTLYELKYRIQDRLEASSDRDFASLTLRLLQVVEQIAAIEAEDVEAEVMESWQAPPEQVTSTVVDVDRNRLMRELVEQKLEREQVEQDG